jgi:hypothetical protein
VPSNTFYGLQHLNENVLCGVRTYLTGDDPEIHEIIEVAVVPFGIDFELHRKFMLFNMRMRPSILQPDDDFKGCKLSRKEIADTCLRAFDADKVADLLLDWFQSMNLGSKKRLIPLTHNFPVERANLVKWLGTEGYREIFSEDHRDLMVAAHYMNDRVGCKFEPVPFSKQTLPWIAKQCNIPPVERGTCLSEANQMGETYKRMLQMHL